MDAFDLLDVLLELTPDRGGISARYVVGVVLVLAGLVGWAATSGAFGYLFGGVAVLGAVVLCVPPVGRWLLWRGA